MTSTTTTVDAGRLAVPGGELYHEVRGSGPLVLVIGQPMTAEPFTPLAELLAADHTVVTYDPHGLGRSTVEDPSLPVTPEVQADDLALLVAHLGGGPADVVASSGGAVTGLALAARHPQLVRTLVAHEPPVCDLLPDAAHVRAVTDGIVEAFEQHGSGAAWGGFVALVVHDGELTGPSVPPAAWSPPGPADGAAGDTAPPQPPEPSAKQQADDALFFLRMLKPFTRYAPDEAALRSGGPRVLVGVGATSGAGVAVRSARALADRLGVTPTVFPGDHGGFMADPQGFAAVLRPLLADPS
ncbi:Pimeloyl-ACP methyl ester carboxylesterase [Friedmanniella luteola]|uniref:Pimeloyl-ACP methyl ester carboxylesterase n=1 Tax=Friedmanniella luteola TaxID=546871 RepID=A0A1H1SIF9_9ACTN|nr:alpha/beta hydrolase [Friedmanniella luteola]SDS47608.1 Pimeloyl-ACP methyl ester carboxylesterase [Friedmanniella luteola]